ncbi:C40 family peptidase [Phenylobacterium sp.]|uniref:C40 family peptidase n=1 Tax=Phenylobacterium sp. TaxID=1871053 RepID=UPI002DF0DBC6|nr:NlpC/P60 family protein [Phenylobacterium sp.]
MKLDPRITPLRDGVASRALEGVEPAEVYVDPNPMVCAAPAAGVHREPSAASEQLDQLLFGETFQALEEEAGGWVWGQAPRDGYVGFVEAARLAPIGPAPTHRISAIRTYAFEGPSIKARALGPYSINSLVRVEAQEGRLSQVAGAGWMPIEHLAPIGVFEADPVAVAERFLGAPYLWGGRESLGCDCSGLVQQAFLACGRACPRDTDQQERLGHEIGRQAFGRGDLVFWKGHMAMGFDAVRIIHANGHHMATALEPLDEAIARIEAAGYGPPTSFRRLPPL